MAHVCEAFSMKNISAVFRFVRQLAHSQAAVESGELNRARDRFFLSLGRRALCYALGDRVSPSVIREVERTITCGANERADDSADTVPDFFFDQPTLLGWAYQVWNTPARDVNSWAISKKTERRSEDVNIGLVTQVFTDQYIADFIATQCIARWFEDCDASRSLPLICDPAVGTGHILASVIKVEATRGITASDTAERLFGYDIDPLCVVIARVVLFCELIRHGFAGDPVVLSATLMEQFRVLEAPYGSLDRAAGFGRQLSVFDIIVTNPPYLGRRKMPAEFRDFLDREYPAASIDLCAAFLQRCVELLAPKGMLGVITSDKWLRLRQYSALRSGRGGFKGVFGELTIDSVHDLGPRAFSNVSDLHDGMRAAILVGSRRAPSPDHSVAYVTLSTTTTRAEKERLLQKNAEELKLLGHATNISQSDLEHGGNVFIRASGLPTSFCKITSKIQDSADVVVGVQTSDDARFVRYVWQPPEDRSGWRVHCKGGGYGRWAGLNRWIINWKSGAAEFLKTGKSHQRAEHWAEKEGWVYTWFANGSLGVRRKEGGWTIGRAAAGGIFPKDPRAVAFMNSRIASAAIRSIGGKIQLPEGTVRAVPAPSSFEVVDASLISLAVELKEQIAAAELTEARFSPGMIPHIESLWHLEALLLVVEGVLEDQVERSLDLGGSEQRGLVSRLGMMAGWYRPTVPLDQHAAGKRMPERYRDFIQRCAGELWGREVVSVARLSYAEMVSVVRSGKVEDLIDSNWMFPSSGVVETFCRAFRLHPFDAVEKLRELLLQPSRMGQRIYGAHIAKCLIDTVLRQLGHRWWCQAETDIDGHFEVLLFDDVVSLARDTLAGGYDPEILGEPLERWVTRVLVEWHDSYFLRASPLICVSGGRGDKVMLRKDSRDG